MLTNKTGGLLLQTIFYLVNQTENDINADSNTLYHLNIGEDNQATRCYGIYGCFKISSPWTSETRPVSLFPESPDKINPRYPMFTRWNPDIPVYLDLNDPDVIQHSEIDGSLPIYLISHGYMEAGDRPWIHRMASEFLAVHPCTVIIVDWHGGSSPPYTQAVANIRLVGAMTAHLLAAISEITGPHKLDQVHMIGHSLGAHLSGYVGYTLQKDFGLTLGRITGLDPAEPHFSRSVSMVRLDRTAAHYVDIIHTDASGFIKGGLGMYESIGHVDYYPNGGMEQPGCSDGVINHIAAARGSFIIGIKKFISCNHVRSHEFFAESIRPSCQFLAIHCPSYEFLRNGKCFECGKNNQHCLKFGFHGRESYRELEQSGKISKGEPISAYLMTGRQKPYCRAHYRINVHLSNSTDSRLHGGEIGVLWIIIHGTTSDSERLALTDSPSFYEPGFQYMSVLAGQDVGIPISATLEWEYRTSMFNPLTWRLMTNPRIYVKNVTIDSLEHGTSITACPGSNMDFNTNLPKKLLPTYCWN